MKGQVPSSSHRRKKTALVIDRDSDVHRFVHVCLGKEFDVHHAYFPKPALSLLAKGRFTLVVASMDMEGCAGEPELNEALVRCSDAQGTPVIRLQNGSADPLNAAGDSVPTLARPLNEDSFFASLNHALQIEAGAFPAYAT